MPPAQTALVIGGGIAGPVAATALAMAGIDAAVYELRVPDPASANGIGGSLALEPNGLAALRIVGAADAVLAEAVPITRSVMSIASKAAREVPMPQGLPPRQLIDRGALHRILRERAEQAGVRIHDAKKLIRVDEYSDGVTAHFADGGSASADVLIGADGVHSTVRRLIDTDAPRARYLGLLGFEGIAEDAPDDAATASLEPGTMTFAFGRRPITCTWSGPTAASAGERIRRRPASHLEGGPRRAGRGLAAHPARDLCQGHTRRSACRRNHQRHPPGRRRPDIMPPVPHWHRGLHGARRRCRARSVQQHRAGRLVGDGKRIQLARCLRDMPDAPSAFAAYERLRRPRVEKIAARGARISHAKAPGPIAQRMMRLMLPVMFATMNIEKTVAAEQRYAIDFDSPVQEDANALA